MVLFSDNYENGYLLNIHEEYKEALKSKSYVELSQKVRNHLGIGKILDEVAGIGQSPPPPPPPPPPQYGNLSGALLEPHQETLVEMTLSGGYNFHHLLMDFFEVSFEASKMCEELLQIVHQNQYNLRIIKRVFKLSKTMECICTDNNWRCQLFNKLNEEFASYSRVSNPLSTFNPVEFRDTQNYHGILFKKLASKYRRTRRRMNITRSFKKVLGGTLIGCSYGRSKFNKPQKKIAKKVSSSSSTSSKLDRLNTQLDVAARGVYTLINDLYTISRIGGRLHDEIEHGKAIANIYIRSGNCMVLKEVLKEFRNHEICYVEMLKEFEDQVYLCLVNVNRSRRLLAGEEEEEPN